MSVRTVGQVPPYVPGSNQVPNVCNLVPPYVRTHGPRFLRLAELVDLELDPWQRDLIVDGLGRTEDNMWSAPEVAQSVSRQNGKGAPMELRCLGGAALLHERLIIYTAHEMKTSIEMYLRMCTLVRRYPKLNAQVQGMYSGNGKERIEFRDGRRILFLARSEKSGRGFSPQLLIWDEAQELDDEEVAAAGFALGAQRDPQIWYAGTPPKLLSETVRGMVWYGVRQRGMAGGPGLLYREWGVPGVDLADLSGVDLDDQAVHAGANPGYPHRVSPATVAREGRLMARSPARFARERLNIWPPPPVDDAGPVDMQRWARLECPDGWLAEGYLSLAFDVTPDRKWSCITAYGECQACGCGRVELVDQRRGTDWLPGILRRYADKYDPVAVGYDPKGPAGSLGEDLAEQGFTVPDNDEVPDRGQLIEADAAGAAAACGQLIDAIARGAVPPGVDVATEGRSLCHPGEPKLTAALAGAKLRPLADASAWARRQAAVDISPVVGISYARWAHIMRALLVPEPGGDDQGVW